MPSMSRLLTTRLSNMRVPSIVCAVFVIIAAPFVMAAEIAPDQVEVNGLSIDKPLTDMAGSAEEGRKVFVNRKQGNCLACHANSDLSDQLFHGEVGPALDGVGSRWQEAQLRTILVNAKLVFTKDTVMPGFYSLDVGANVREDLIGKTILSAQQIEDLVAYLTTLK